jgi:hypothetical protein
MTVVFIIFFLSYISLVFFLIRGWRKVTAQNISEVREYSPQCTIIIPVRNEAASIQNLLDDILDLSYKIF